MPDAAFTTPDLTTFTGLYVLGLTVVGQRLEPDRAVLDCRVTEPGGWCRRCGCQGCPDGTVVCRLAHASAVLCTARILQKAQRLAATDSLTGLGNRASTIQALEHALAQQERHGGHLAVLFVDLDGFKAVNDTLGHQAGDDLLVQVARRPRATLRASDTPGRYGGDEFVVVAEGLAEPGYAHLLVERLVHAITSEYELPALGEGITRSARIGTSIGVAVAADPAGRGAGYGASPSPSVVDRATALLMAADEAMYDDKESRRASSQGDKERDGAS